MDKKKILHLIILIACIFVGNRIYNHFNAWIGIAVIAAGVIFYIYKLTKTEK